jgi:hypothetical protein
MLDVILLFRIFSYPLLVFCLEALKENHPNDD